MKIEIIVTSVNRYILMDSDRKLSMTSTSLENRLTILPSGVVSKNDLGIVRIQSFVML
jgi:hypothetical protein